MKSLESNSAEAPRERLLADLVAGWDEWFYWCTPSGDERVALGVRSRTADLRDPGEAAYFSLSFDGRRADVVVPEKIVANLRPTSSAPAAASVPDTVDDYRGRVRSALRAIASDLASKIVVAREHRIDRVLDVPRTLEVMRDTFPNCFVFGRRQADGTAWVGATPERLVKVEGRTVETAAVAGTASPGRGLELRNSPKDRAEHEAVAAMLRNELVALCETVDIATEPDVLELPHLVHLVTPMRGALRNGETPFEVIRRLHPTPAVCGTPREAARRLLTEIEGFDRDLYTGVVGWSQPGEVEAAVAIRTMKASGGQTFAYAGAGIVAGSDPDAEDAETRLKLGSVLGAAQWSTP